MSLRMSIWFVIFLHIYLVLASDSDPVQDFCIPRSEFSTIFVSCKNSSSVTIEDFVYSGIKNPGEFSKTGFSSIPVSMNIGDSRATILGSFNSQNPGIVKIPSSVFGSEIEEEILIKAFGLNKKELAKLKKFLHAS
ncbi:unnamed protein product [Fraxinus pennsylvanica]|uniref:Cupin type-1 domain-containing protein n=1 Tax=Fraxinus pennsylvanica TaxID=56036 RepID=A0AAD1YYN6_9LAMI|nr:unnamed protein product [Fraxinus pennsylvanica]